jgi:hypothetical protein
MYGESWPIVCDRGEAGEVAEITVLQEQRSNEDERRPFVVSLKPACGRLSSIEQRAITSH